VHLFTFGLGFCPLSLNAFNYRQPSKDLVSHTNPNAVGATPPWVAVIARIIHTLHPLWAREPGKAATSLGLDTNPNAVGATLLWVAVIARIIDAIQAGRAGTAGKSAALLAYSTVVTTANNLPGRQV
jgi:hypothetical protein